MPVNLNKTIKNDSAAFIEPLTKNNYFSKQAGIDYMSVSQFKDLIGSTATLPCEFSGVNRIYKTAPEKESISLLVGSYVDSYFEGTLDEFKAEHPEIFKKTGDKGLKAEYIVAENIIRRIESDTLFKEYMSGEKQVIMTANIFGVNWKIKMDSYHKNDKIVDLKVMKDMMPIWSDLKRQKVDFITYWGYDIQGAIYQKVVEINTGKKLPFFIACATKETPSNIEIIHIPQKYLDAALHFVEENIDHAINLKNRSIEPKRCGVCAFCREKKILIEPISLEQIMPVRYTADENTTEPVSLFDDI